MEDSKNALDQIYDVIIVGAGPAGAPAACYLKLFDTRSVLKILLIEKNSDPTGYDKYHHKCGEGVNEGFLDEIAPIQAVPDSITTHVTTAREYWGTGHVTESPTKECILNRPAFLHGVVDSYAKAGGEIRWDEVLKVGVEGELARVTCKSGFTALARVVIGADGPNSRIRSLMGFPKPIIITAMQYLIPNDPVDDHTMIVWYGARYHGGYKYIFPYGPGKGKLGFIKGTTEYDGPSYELQAKQMAFGGIPSFVKDNVVLIGSAAAFTNPFTGGGIKIGFIAARVLANDIVKAVQGTEENKRTSRMVTAIKRFEARWKKSPYFSGRYMKSYEQFSRMDDAAIERLGEPFYLKGKMRRAFALLKNIDLWPLYKAFIDSARYS